MYRTPLSIAVAVVNSTIAFSSVAQTENTETQSSNSLFNLEEVVVTATRRESKLPDTPLSISALSDEALEIFNVNDVSNLAQLVPGLQIRDNGVDGQGSVDISIRGVGNSNYIETGEPNVSFNIDGVYTARPQAALQLFSDVERVEVTRGPQGTLSGRNATTGSINVITKKPHFDAVEGALEIEAGSYAAKGINGVLNLPVGDSLALRFNFAKRERDSFYNLVRDDDLRGATLPTDFSGDNIPEFETNYGDPTDDGPGSPGSEDSQTFRVSGLFKPNEAFSWLLTYEQFEDKAVGKPFTLDCERADCEANLTREQIPQADPYTAFLSVRGEQDQKIQNFRSVIDASFDGLFDIKYTYGQTEFDHTLVQDLDAGLAIELVFIDEPWLNESEVHDLQFSSNGEGALDWVAGLFYFKEETDRNFGVSFFPFGFQIFPNPNYTVETTAAYADFTYDFTDRFEGFFGVRHSNDKKSNEGSARYEFLANNFACPGALSESDPQGRVFINAGFDQILNTPECFTSFLTTDDTDESFTDFRIGGKYNLTDDTNVYASIASGHKAALQTQRIVNTRAGGFLDIPVETEKLISYEIGSKGKAFDGSLNFAAAIFYMDYKDKQEAQFLNFGDTGCDLNGNGINDSLDRNGATLPEEGFAGCGADEPFSFDTIVDLVDTEFPDQVEYSVTNAAGVDIFGLELEAASKVGNNGYLNGFVTYTKAEYEDFSYSHVLGCPNPNLEHCSIHNVSGNTPRSTPEFTFNLTYSHTFDLGKFGQIVPSINSYYRSKYFLTPENIEGGIDPTLIQQGNIFDNVLDDNGNPTNLDADGNELGQGNVNESELYSDVQDDSIIVNFNVTYTSPGGSFNAQLFGNNIFDEVVRTNARIDTAQTIGFVYEDPAQFGVRLKYNF